MFHVHPGITCGRNGRQNCNKSLASRVLTIWKDETSAAVASRVYSSVKVKLICGLHSLKGGSSALALEMKPSLPLTEAQASSVVTV